MKDKQFFELTVFDITPEFLVYGNAITRFVNMTSKRGINENGFTQNKLITNGDFNLGGADFVLVVKLSLSQLEIGVEVTMYPYLYVGRKGIVHKSHLLLRV